MGSTSAFGLYVCQKVGYTYPKVLEYDKGLLIMNVVFLRRLRTVSGENGLTDPKLTLDEGTRAAFAGAPLVSLGLDNHVSFLNLEELKRPPISSDLPFDVSHHPQAQSAVAGLMMARLEAEMKHYANIGIR